MTLMHMVRVILIKALIPYAHNPNRKAASGPGLCWMAKTPTLNLTISQS